MTEQAATWEPTDSLVPWAKNPRINEHAVDHVMGSIQRFGFASPIIARTSDRMVIAGHTRLKAAIKLGLTKVPVRFMDLDPADAELLALADNKVGEVATWDDDALAGILADLRDQGADVLLSGFDQDEVDVLLGAWTNPFEGEPPRTVLVDESKRTIRATVPITDAARAEEIIEAALGAAGIAAEVG